MILDNMSAAGRYVSLHSQFEKAFAFLARADISDLEPGKYEIEGKNVFASVACDDGRGKDGAKLEVHRKYIDIQYVVSGTEVIGWSPLESMNYDGADFEEDRDVGFPKAEVESWFNVLPGEYAIFFPEDGHAPLASDGKVKKVIIKIACE